MGLPCRVAIIIQISAPPTYLLLLEIPVSSLCLPEPWSILLGDVIEAAAKALAVLLAEDGVKTLPLVQGIIYETTQHLQPVSD